MLVLCAGSAAAATPPASVAVVEFYSPTPLPVVDTVIPEQTAADELAALLADRAGSLAVVPPATAAQAEASLRWRSEDALSFTRLADLARVIGASRLVVGWISTLSLEGMTNLPDGNGMPLAQASVIVQIFDAGQGRVVAETRGSASTVGVVPAILVRDVLRDALAPTVPWLISQLSPTSMLSVANDHVMR